MALTRTDYEHPDEVLEDDNLSRLQKSTLLARWAYDELRLMSSSYEGMAGGRKSRLHEVMEALREVTPEDSDGFDLGIPKA
ncbi:MAG: hypothetical protein VYE40_03480 [Myxococcota bacterium]|jgi:hypothetical protein|nr:hypothetical protein [Myxococcota bacterium]MEC9440147.1 hypothetical protein [Myxococcota bacterium]